MDAKLDKLDALLAQSTQIATLPGTPALRREEIRLQVALLYPLQHVKGQGAPALRAAAERAILLIEQAEKLRETCYSWR